MDAIAYGEELNQVTDKNSLWTLYGDKIKYKVVNFDNEIFAPKSGIIEVIATKISKRHENYLSFATALDREHGFLYGIPNGIDTVTGHIKWQRITITSDYETFDLSKPKERMKWIVIKNCYCIAGSPNLKDKPKWKVINKEEEAANFLQKRHLKRKAEQIAEGLIGDVLVEMGLNLGLQVDMMSSAVLQQNVIQAAERDAKGFMEIWDSPTRKELTILKRAVAVGVINFDTRLGYTYNALPLGSSEGQVVEYLRSNANVSQTLDMSARAKEKSSVKAMQAQISPVKDEKDAEIERLKAEYDTMKQKWEAAARVSIEEIADKTIASIDPELVELQQEALSLKIPGAKLTKNKDLLRQKIADKKAEANN